jgi:phage terminase Nu1 subunit (DNA packaging protein)
MKEIPFGKVVVVQPKKKGRPSKQASDADADSKPEFGSVFDNPQALMERFNKAHTEREEALARKASADASIAEVEAEKTKKSVVSVDEIEDEYTQIMCDLRDRFISLPAVFRMKFPDDDQSRIDFLAQEINDMLLVASRRKEIQ